MTFNALLIVLVLLLLKNDSHAVTNKQYASIPDVFYAENYDSCMLLEDEALYCLFQYVLEPVDKDNPSETWNIIRNLSAIETNYRHDYLQHSICVPKTCPGIQLSDEKDPIFVKSLENCYNKKFKELEIKGTITEIHCSTQDPRYPVDWLDRVCGTLFAMYIAFVVYATYYEVIAGYMNPEDYKKLTSTTKGKILSAFSISKNWIRLKTVKSTTEIEKFRSIQAIRFYNSALVVLSHTILGVMSNAVSNTKEMEELFAGSPTSIFFGMGHLCMSTFFFISSFLLSYGLFTHRDTNTKNKRGTHLEEYVLIFALKVFRLLPPFIFVILFNATWLRHTGSGPVWKLMEREFLNCRKNSWTNLLFINNMVYHDDMCLPTSWFMALSMQYLIVSLLFIWLLKKYEKYAWYILGAATLSHLFCAFLQNYYYDLPALQISPIQTYVGLINFLASNQFKYQIGSFIGNLAGVIVGIAFGYYYNTHQREKPDEKIFNNRRGKIIFRTMCVLAVSCIVVPGIVILLYSDVHDAFWASIYLVLSRIIFTLAIGTLIIGFSEGVGGLALRFFRWPPMYVLGRLTYSVYLVHMSVMMIGPCLKRYSEHVSPLSMVLRFSSDMVTVYLAAFLLTLFIELPVTALQKIIFVPKDDSKEERNGNIKHD